MASLPTGMPFPSYQEHYYEQALDHFGAGSQRARWKHRFLLSAETWDGRGALPGGCRGPILLYAGNEGDIDAFWGSNGFMIEVLAPKFGALLVFAEERFYGKSLPFGPASLEARHLAFLSTAQILADYVELLGHLKATLPGAAACPVVAFGGSYGGTLAALLRSSHPEAVLGAVASSSELGYYDVDGWAAHGVDEFTFEDIVTGSYFDIDQDCPSLISDATEAVEGASEDDVVRAFGVCEAAALGPARRSDLFTYALEGLPQLNYPYAVGAMPAHPVGRVCELLARAAGTAGLVKAAGSATRMALGYSGASCIPVQSVGGPGNTPGDGPGPGAWGWQSCTETLHRFSARELRTYNFSLAGSTALCGEVFGPAAAPDLSLLARRFGGYALAEGRAGATNVIWSQGTLDPWHGWFRNLARPQKSSGMHHFLMQGAAHHLDLRAPHPADPPDVAWVRAQATQIIQGWINGSAAQGQPALFV